MQHFSRTCLAASISTALFVPTTQAEANINDSVQEMPTTDQCLVETSGEEDALNSEVVVQADRLQAINGDKAQYSGNVEVTQGPKKITADSVTLHQQDNVVVAEGNVTFNDGKVKARSDRVTNDINQDTFSLENTDYQFLCQQGRGTAAYIARTGQSVYELEDGSITSCPQGDNSWRLVASGIDVDQDEETATLHHPRFEVLDVPVFYVPYLTMPIGDTRKTGFLFPSMSYGSSDGMEVEIPFYWNIAPQYDMTITPLYMQKRGTKLDTDFRYLTNGWGDGEVKGEYMGSDKKYDDESRWGYQFKHDGIINKQWVVSLDYSKVSDIDYFRDLDSDIGNREDGQLLQEGEVQYRSDFWDASLRVRDFQILLQEDNQPYRLLPQLDLNYYTPLWGNYVNFDVKSQVSRFDTDDPAWRRLELPASLESASYSAFELEVNELRTYQGQSDVFVTNEQGSITAMTFGGGANALVTELLGDAGTISSDFGGNPPYQKMYDISRIVYKHWLAQTNVLFIIGGKANNTDIYTTFRAMADALRDDFNGNGRRPLFVVVGRGGPNLIRGMAYLKDVLDALGVPYRMFGHDSAMSGVVNYARAVDDWMSAGGRAEIARCMGLATA